MEVGSRAFLWRSSGIVCDVGTCHLRQLTWGGWARSGMRVPDREGSDASEPPSGYVGYVSVSLAVERRKLGA
jgi:hypothetical protein